MCNNNEKKVKLMPVNVLQSYYIPAMLAKYSMQLSFINSFKYKMQHREEWFSSHFQNQSFWWRVYFRLFELVEIKYCI